MDQKNRLSLNKRIKMKFINDFEAHYNYDCSYMRDLKKYSPEFSMLLLVFPMGKVGSSLPVEVLWMAKSQR